MIRAFITSERCTNMSNVLKATFGSATSIRTAPLYQYDYGQQLQFTDVDLPSYTEVHFSNSDTGDAIVMLATDGLVSIPDDLLRTGKAVFAWVFVHSGDSDGETIYRVSIPVLIRAKPTEETPTPTQQTIIEQAIAELNATIEATEDIRNMQATAETLPSDEQATASYANGLLTLGIPQGEKGDTGEQGEKGDTGETGVGIASITLTGQSGNLDTYTIAMTDGSTSTFTVQNGYSASLPSENGTYELRLTKTASGYAFNWIKAMTLAE